MHQAVQLNRATQWLRKLLWAYFFLWIFEGVLRKWLLPQLSDVLLLIRDPLLLVIYAVAIANGLAPQNKLLAAAGILGAVCTLAGFLVLPEGVAVVVFGARTDFLYIPLIFLIPQVWDRADVEKIGYATLLLSVPMAALMLAQFLASPESLINAGAAGSVGGQIGTARGHIRPAGTFSFITGPLCFFSLTMAFLLNQQLSALKTWRLLTVAATLAVIIAVVCSGSRSLLVAVGLVVFTGAAIVFVLNQRLFFRWALSGFLYAGATALLAQFPFFAEGTSTLTERLLGGQGTLGAGVQVGLGERIWSGFSDAVALLSDTPVFGKGLGLGTLTAGKLMTGKTAMLLAEEEWSRVILESGPFLGGAFLLLRIVVFLSIARVAVLAATRDRNALPALLLAAAGPPIINGQWGQTTTLGFTVFCAGLALAAAKNPPVAPALQNPSSREAELNPENKRY